jgi:transcription antitermination factor NusG
MEKPNLKKWLVLRTPPRAEKRVSKILDLNNVENYLPLQKRLQQWHDRKKWVEVPLFNSYIFIYCDIDLKNNIYEYYNRIKFLSIGGKIAELQQHEIDRIKKLCSYHNEIEIAPNIFLEGEKVEIQEGIFIGETGYLIKVNGTNKVKMHINGLSCSAIVEIERTYLKKILN